MYAHCMAVTANFINQPLQVNTTQRIMDRISAIAEAEQISRAQVVRDLIDAGIDRRERIMEKRLKS